MLDSRKEADNVCDTRWAHDQYGGAVLWSHHLILI